MAGKEMSWRASVVTVELADVLGREEALRDRREHVRRSAATEARKTRNTVTKRKRRQRSSSTR